MHTKEDCLELIKSVREIADDPHSAYLLRTRIKRALLSTIRLAATYAGAEAPTLPRTFFLPSEAPQKSKEIVNACNNLLANTRRLCQPSEALDTRWNQGWASVLDDLGLIEEKLREWPNF
jgi:hypothetical protein